MVAITTTATTVANIAADSRMNERAETRYDGDCEAPVYIYLAGLPDGTLARLGIAQLGRVSEHLFVRCRRCPACQAQRSRVWTARAIAETLASRRTWFATLTLAPDRATQARYAADSRLARRISDRGDSANQFAAMVDFVNPEITRFLKRVRKNSDAALRYLCVAEAHKSGLPHWHMLIHENAGRATKAVLSDAWRYGFSQFRLVETMDPRAARYACKYLSKTAMTRIRASRFYGSAVPDHITERILSATRLLREGLREEYQQQADITSLSKEDEVKAPNNVIGDLTPTI